MRILYVFHISFNIWKLYKVSVLYRIYFVTHLLYCSVSCKKHLNQHVKYVWHSCAYTYFVVWVTPFWARKVLKGIWACSCKMQCLGPGPRLQAQRPSTLFSTQKYNPNCVQMCTYCKYCEFISTSKNYIKYLYCIVSIMYGICWNLLCTVRNIKTNMWNTYDIAMLTVMS